MDPAQFKIQQDPRESCLHLASECEEKKIRARRDDQADKIEWPQWDAKEWAVKIVNCMWECQSQTLNIFKCCKAERQSSLCRKSDHKSVMAGIKSSEKARERERESAR